MKKIICSVLFTVLLIFAASLCVNAETEAEKVYMDAKNEAWYAKSSVYCFEQGYMNGTSDAVFSPNSKVTRGMFVTILSKMKGDNLSSYANTASFKDVPLGKWYHNAVEWAFANGFAKGTGGGYFNPDSAVSRQDIAVMLYTYTKKTSTMNVNVNLANIESYRDCSKISGYAFEALRWCVGNNLISGTSDTMISPKSTATRAMISVIISNYDKKFGHDWVQISIINNRTCTVDGKVSYRCTRCETVKEVTTKAWHVWDSGVITVKPTCVSTGTRVYKCVCCNASYSDSVAKLPHSFVNGHCTFCTAVSGANDLILGTWYNSYIHDVGTGTYYEAIDMTVTFYSNGECVTYINGKYYKDTWEFIEIEDNIWYYYLSDGSVVGFYNDPDSQVYKMLGYAFDDDYVYVMSR